ncbi:MAG: oligoendopeptidase F [Christensenellales bacterium]|jgi:oligoendopeptidase F
MHHINSEVPAREQIEGRYKWRLEDLFDSDEAFEEALKQFPEYAKLVAGHQGGCLNSADALFAALDDHSKAELAAERLLVYARLKRDEDTAVEKYQGYLERIGSMLVDLSEAASYLSPELLQADPDLIRAYQAENEKLAPYARFFVELERQRPHCLPQQQEQLLALSGDMANTADAVYTIMTDLDMSFEDIKGPDGERIVVTHGRYRSLMENPDRSIRKAAYDSRYKSYRNQINTIAATLSGSLKKDLFYAKARKYASVREMNLYADNVPVSLYDTLIDTTEAATPLLHRYMALRRKLLGVDELHFYDIYVPLYAYGDEQIRYDDGAQMALASVAPLGDTYTRDFSEALKSGWIDVYENRGKASGAYSWGAYRSHPYVLLNYDGLLEDVFTLAHEMGHAMHSFYSNKNQPQPTAGYSIFVAEVASTVNEWLLWEHLYNNTQDKKKKAALLNTRLEIIRTTAMRQVQFATFERDLHQMAQEGMPLQAGVISRLYQDINRRYYGSEIIYDDNIALEWAVVSHFYRAFYVYQYATGISAAASLAEGILRGDGAERYIGFLSSGSGADVLDLLKDAGVDLSSGEPTRTLYGIFERTLDKLESLIQEEGWIK